VPNTALTTSQHTQLRPHHRTVKSTSSTAHKQSLQASSAATQHSSWSRNHFEQSSIPHMQIKGQPMAPNDPNVHSGSPAEPPTNSY
jgi:hypothetical protein